MAVFRCVIGIRDQVDQVVREALLPHDFNQGLFHAFIHCRSLESFVACPLRVEPYGLRAINVVNAEGPASAAWHCMVLRM